MIDKIVTLEDGKEYCIIGETDYNGKNYCVGIEYFEAVDSISDEYYVFEEDYGDDRVSLKLVDDSELEDYIILKISSEKDEI